jgi:hypothetical protein
MRQSTLVIDNPDRHRFISTVMTRCYSYIENGLAIRRSHYLDGLLAGRNRSRTKFDDAGFLIVDQSAVFFSALK